MARSGKSAQPSALPCLERSLIVPISRPTGMMRQSRRSKPIRVLRRFTPSSIKSVKGSHMPGMRRSASSQTMWQAPSEAFMAGMDLAIIVGGVGIIVAAVISYVLINDAVVLRPAPSVESEFDTGGNILPEAAGAD